MAAKLSPTQLPASQARISYRRTVVTLITRFVTGTAAWGWDDVPTRVLFTRRDIPKIPKPLPRFIPDHEVAKLMPAVDQLPNPYQRAALIVARWSGARRDQIRRLAVECLNTYPDGHPRLRIPVGKGYTERSMRCTHRPPKRCNRSSTWPRPANRRSPHTDSDTPSTPSSPKAEPASRRSWPCSATRSDLARCA